MTKIADCFAKSLANKKGYKCGKWNTSFRKDAIIVSHYGTEMLKVPTDRMKIERAVGFESMSDKQGVNKILRELSIQEKDVKKIKAERGFIFD